MTAIAVIQARMGSSRFPGKVLEDLGGEPVLARMVRIARAIPGIDDAVVATSTEAGDDAIAAWCAGAGTACHRGSETDVLARVHAAAGAEDADVIMRLTGDCPLLDPHVCGEVLYLLESRGLAYASNIDPRSWPDGLDCEAFTAEALETAAANARRAFEREHVTPYIRNNRDRFPAANVTCPIPGLAAEEWTLDNPRDLDFLRALLERLGTDTLPGYVDVLRVLEHEPDLRDINRAEPRNPTAVAAPDLACYGYARSQQLLGQTLERIPLASQTFSKSHIQYPAGESPLFVSHGQGGRVWDVDGNEYVDLVGGLLPVVLGYRDPDVDNAVRAQLDRGIAFSLTTRLEDALAERLCEIIPCAEMVRFGKNGTDATSAAIRLARAHTGRDGVITCGYHGWQDWYIGATTRNKGVPKAVSALTRTVPYGDLDALEARFAENGDVAAVIMEPMNAVEPPAGYLAGVRDLAHRHGALLVFDEIITGFRYDLGGAQALFGVTPDLASFGKAMGNGMPVSAIVGRADVMREMEEIFFSGTFGGEALSLAAAIAVIDKMRREPVIETLWRTGGRLSRGALEIIDRHGLGDAIGLAGKAPWRILQFRDCRGTAKEAIKTLFLREMIRNGVLVAASHNVCYAHGEADIAQILAAYDAACGVLADAIDKGDAETRLGGNVIRPVFSVR